MVVKVCPICNLTTSPHSDGLGTSCNKCKVAWREDLYTIKEAIGKLLACENLGVAKFKLGHIWGDQLTKEEILTLIGE